MRSQLSESKKKTAKTFKTKIVQLNATNIQRKWLKIDCPKIMFLSSRQIPNYPGYVHLLVPLYTTVANVLFAFISRSFPPPAGEGVSGSEGVRSEHLRPSGQDVLREVFLHHSRGYLHERVRVSWQLCKITPHV